MVENAASNNMQANKKSFIRKCLCGDSVNSEMKYQVNEINNILQDEIKN